MVEIYSFVNGFLLLDYNQIIMHDKTCAKLYLCELMSLICFNLLINLALKNSKCTYEFWLTS